MTDPDDVEAIALVRATEDLIAASQRLADPEMGLWRWFDMTLAVLVHQQCPSRPLSWVMLSTLRRTTVEIESSL